MAEVRVGVGCSKPSKAHAGRHMDFEPGWYPEGASWLGGAGVVAEVVRIGCANHAGIPKISTMHLKSMSVAWLRKLRAC